MSGFQSPNHTQVPNDLFDVLLSLKGNDKMSEAELRVTLVLIRATLGFHRPQKRMSIRNLARAAGLSASNAYRGAREAVQRGTFRELHDGGISQWEIIWTVPVAGTGVPVAGTVEANSVPATGTPSIKEKRLKKEIERKLPPPKPPKAKSLTPQQQMIQSLAAVTGLDDRLNGSRLARLASALLKQGYQPEQILKIYGSGGPYWSNDWRGRKGQKPNETAIRETISELIGRNHAEADQRNVVSPEEWAAARPYTEEELEALLRE